MHKEGLIRIVGGLMAIMAVSGALLLVDSLATDPAVADRPPVQVLGQVETRASVSPPAAVTGTVAVPVVPAPPASSPTTTVPALTVPSTTLAPAARVDPIGPPPTTTAPPPGPEDRARQAIVEIGYPWEAKFPTWTIEVAGARSGVRALTHPDRKLVELFVRGDDTVADLRRILAHELGHVADLELNDSTDRRRWRDARGVGASVPWWPTGTTYDFDTLAGDFAEGFAAWLEGSATQSRVGGALEADQLALMGELAA